MKKITQYVFAAALLVMAQFALAAEWYEGGTLVKANALEWQQASHANKLASAGDMIATFYNQKKLVPELQAKVKTMDDMKVLATALVTEMDAAFEPESDPATNRQLYANQQVGSTAVMLMAMNGWLKL